MKVKIKSKLPNGLVGKGPDWDRALEAAFRISGQGISQASKANEIADAMLEFAAQELERGFGLRARAAGLRSQKRGKANQ